MKLNFTGSSVTLDAAAADSEPRISGIAAPYGVDAEVSTGQRVRIMAGALPVDGKMPRLVIEHDTSRVVGVVDMREETDAGMLFSARIADTTEGRDLIALLKMNALDSVSVGLSVQDYEMDGKTMLVKAAAWEELSVVYQPAFPQAQITQIAASNPDEDEPEPNTEENPVSENPTPVEAAAAEAIPTQPLHAAAAKPARLPSAAEYIAGILKGGDAAEAVRKQLRAAAPNVTTADDGGLLPEILTAPVYDNFIGQRPVVDAVGTRAMPAEGAVFRVPYVSTHNSVAQQAAEQDTLQASLYAVSSFDITKLTFGGYSVVSEQIIDWSSPEIIGSMLADMGRVYAYQTDNYAADQLLAGCSQSAVLTEPTSPSEWVSDIYDAAVTIINNSNGNVPTHLFLSPNMFGYLGKLVDTTGRPLLAPTMPMNAFGSQAPSGAFANGSAFGLTVVVDRGFAADTVIVGDPSGYQCWEQQKGAIAIDAPSTLSRTIAFRGYFATKMVDATKFVKLT